MQLWKVPWTPKEQSPVRAKSLRLQDRGGGESRCLFCFGGGSMYRLVTNNPLARRHWRESECAHMSLHWREGSLLDVLVAARDMVHLGWRLLNHPLTSSLKPSQTPYKTIILARGEGLDYQSLQVLEGALATAQKMGVFPGGSQWLLADLQLIDMEMCKEVFDQIRRGVSV